MEIDLSLPAKKVIKTLEQIIEWRDKPSKIRSDNGPEYLSHELRDWLKKQSIEHQFIEPGKPQQNVYIERYNRTVSYDLLNRYLFSSIEEVQNQATNWLWMYNNERPHKANQGYPPCGQLKQLNSPTFFVFKMGGLPKLSRYIEFFYGWLKFILKPTNYHFQKILNLHYLIEIV